MADDTKLLQLRLHDCFMKFHWHIGWASHFGWLGWAVQASTQIERVGSYSQSGSASHGACAVYFTEHLVWHC